MLSRFSRYKIIVDIEGCDVDSLGEFNEGSVSDARSLIVESIKRLMSVGGEGWS